MSPRPDPFELPDAPNHVMSRQIYDQMAKLYRAIGGLADIITAQNGEIAALRRAVENRQAVAENCRLNAKRRWHKEKNSETPS